MQLVSKSSVFIQSFFTIQIIVLLIFCIFNNIKLINATSLQNDVNQEEIKDNMPINTIDANDNSNDGNDDIQKLCVSCKLMNDLINTMKTLINQLEDVAKQHCNDKSINKKTYDSKNRGARAMSQVVPNEEQDLPTPWKTSQWMNSRRYDNVQDQTNPQLSSDMDSSLQGQSVTPPSSSSLLSSSSSSSLPTNPKYRIDQQKNQNQNQNTNTNKNSFKHLPRQLIDDNNQHDKQQNTIMPSFPQGISRITQDKNNLMNIGNNDLNNSPTYIIDDNYDQENGKNKNKIVFVCSRIKDNKRKKLIGDLRNNKKNSYRKHNDMLSSENDKNENKNINTNINTNKNFNKNSNRRLHKPMSSTEMIILNSNETVAFNETDLNNSTSFNNDGTMNPM